MANLSEGWNVDTNVVRPLPVLRVPNNEVPVEAIIESRDYLCLGQHFFARPYICPGRDCPACESGHGARVLVYLLVEAKSRTFLLEANRDAFGSFLDPCRGNYTGHTITITRRRRRLIVQWDEKEPAQGSLRAGIRPLIDAVAILYKLQTTARIDSKLDDAKALVQWRGVVVPTLQEMLRRAIAKG